ncbi:MAG: GNAT family N-acetyltransferase [Proteobacteria bacterium]|nr:GNAT family N-acetyltransferase [Pseudomonadota bacterium]
MDAVFRKSAQQLCVKAYGSDIVDAWAGEPRPDRFVLGAENGDEQYVLLLKGKIVCFGAINIDKQLLESLFVTPSHAGSGLGCELLKFLVEKATIAGVKVLRLDSSLNAVNFYVRNGFVEQRESEFMSKSGIVLKSVIMERALYK